MEQFLSHACHEMILYSRDINNIFSFICRKRKIKHDCLGNPTILNYCGSTLLKGVKKPLFKVINKKRSDNDDDREVTSPKFCVGSVKNETHSVRVLYYSQNTFSNKLINIFTESYFLW